MIFLSKNKDFDAVVLWDPTHTGYWQGKKVEEDESYVFEPTLGLFRSVSGISELVSREMLESFHYLDSNKLISELQVPVKVIIAGANLPHSVVARKQFYDFANEPKSIVIIDDADHLFQNGETMIELHSETVKWFKESL